MRWKMVAKQVNPDGNIIDIGLVWENGNTDFVGRLVFPNDHMICNNVRVIDGVIKLLKARFRDSV